MSSAQLIVICNPFEPELHTFEIDPGKTIREYIGDVLPQLLFLNREELSDLDYVIQDGDIFSTFLEPGYIAPWILWAMAIVAVAISIYTLTQLPGTPSDTGQSNTYNLRAQSNFAQIGNPVPVQYGKMQSYPDLLAKPWFEYASNVQYLHQLFCIGLGEYNVTNLRISDTPIAGFEEVSSEILYQGPITLFPSNIEVSIEVANNYMTTTNVGPFTANATLTKTNKISVDFVFSEGLFRTQSDGDVQSMSAGNIIVDYLEINDAGTPIGSWTNGITQYQENTIREPYHITLSFAVPLGRYQIRARRSQNDGSANPRWHDKLNWEGMRAFITNSVLTYTGATIMAVRMKATEQLSAVNARSINALVERKIPIWNGTSWSANTITRNPAWAITDVLRNSVYGAGRPDSEIDNAAFLTFATWCTTNSFNFDGRFDVLTNIWKAIEEIAACGRGYIIPIFSVISIKAEQTQTLPAWTFNHANMINEQFQLTYDRSDDYDSISSRFLDETDSYKEDTLTVSVTGTQLNPRDMDYRRGIVNRAHLFKILKFLAGKDNYSNLFVEFDTELEGYLPDRGDLISVVTDSIGDLSIAGEITSYVNSTKKLTFSQPLSIDFLGLQYAVMLRQPDGTVSGPHSGTIDPTDPFSVILNTALTWDPNPTPDRYPVIGAWGELSYSFRNFIVLGIKPRSENLISISAVIYDARVYDLTGTAVGPPVRPALPSIADQPIVYSISFQDGTIPYTVGISWLAQQGWKYFEIQFSRDNVNWSPSVAVFAPYYQYSIGIIPYTLYVRVRAIGNFAGAWTSSSSPVATGDKTPPDVTLTTMTDPLAGADYAMQATLTYTWTVMADAAQYYWMLRDSGGNTILDGYLPLGSTNLVFTKAQILLLANTGRSGNLIGSVRVCPASITGKYDITKAQTVNILNSQATAPTTVVATEGVSAFIIDVTATEPPDIKGLIVHVSDSNGFTPGLTNKVYDAEFTKTLVIPTEGSNGQIKYIRVGMYDVFGKDSINYYAQIALTITNNLETDSVISKQFGGSLVANPTFDLPRSRSGVGSFPAAWYYSGDQFSDMYYSDATRDKVNLDHDGAGADSKLISSAFPPNPASSYEVIIRIRAKASTPTVVVGFSELDTELTDVKYAVHYQVAATANDAEIQFSATRSIAANNMVLSTSFTLHRFQYIPTSTALWTSVYLLCDAGEDVEVDYIFVRDMATAGSGVSGEVTALNPNFELGDRYWTKGTAWSITKDPANAHQGNFVASITGAGALSKLVNDVRYPINAGDIVTWGGFAKTSVSYTGGVITFRVQFRDSTGAALASADSSSVGGANQPWTGIQASGVAPASSQFVSLEVILGGSQSAGTAYADDGYLMVQTGAVAGDNLYNAAGGLLKDIDIRNDSIVASVLSAINYNASMQFSRRNPASGLAPAGWYRYNTTSQLAYDDDNTRDILKLPGNGAYACNAALSVIGKTQYEVHALIRDAAGSSSVCDIVIQEYDSELATTGKSSIGGATNAEAEIQTATRQIIIADNISLTTSFAAIGPYSYVPTSTCKWFSVSIYDGNTSRDIRIDWCIVDVKAQAPPSDYTSYLPAPYDDSNYVTGAGAYSGVSSATITLVAPGYASSTSVKVTGVTTNNATWGVHLDSSTSLNSINIPVARRWLITAWVRRAGTINSAIRAGLHSAINNGGVPIYGTSQQVMASANTWYKVAWIIDITTGALNVAQAVALRFIATNAGTPGSTPDFYVDAISMVDVTELLMITESSYPLPFFPASRINYATENYAGVTELATYTETYTGTDTSRTLTVKNHADYHRVWSNYESSEQSWAQTGNIAHNVGSVPDSWQVVARCITAQFNFVAGDEVNLLSFGDSSNINPVTFVNANNWGWAFNAATTFYSPGKTGGSWGGSLTAANWKIVLRARWS